MYFDMNSDLIVYVMGCVCASFYLSCCPSFYFPDISVRSMGDRDVNAPVCFNNFQPSGFLMPCNYRC